MGWSCRTEAARVLEQFGRLCVERTGKSNVFRTARGEYFLETSNVEHDDGAVTGSVWRVLGAQDDGTYRCQRSGSLRIEGDGTVTRGPALLREAAKQAAATA